VNLPVDPSLVLCNTLSTLFQKVEVRFPKLFFNLPNRLLESDGHCTMNG
jgi:hypothetical protein